LLAFLNNTRVVVAGLAIVALILGTLIYRDVFVPAKNTASALNLYTVARRNVTASITGSGNLVPDTEANLNFKVAGTLTEIDVKVGDHVMAGQKIAKIDDSSAKSALAMAEANVLTASANLQSVETPLTQAQVAQLQNNVSVAQQAYNDAVAQANLTNSQDASQVDADQAQLTADEATLDASFAYQQDKSKLAADKAQLATDRLTFDADGCVLANAPFSTNPCMTDFTNVLNDQSAVAADQSKLTLDAAQVNADRSKLSADDSKQQTDKVAGRRSVDQAAASLTSARDQLKTQTQTKPNQVAAANAQLASAQAAVLAARQNLDATTLYAPMDGEVNSINGVVGEAVGAGGGTTAEAPGGQAPLPSGTASSAFIQIGNVSGMEVVIPFAEADAARIADNQDAQLTFDAVPNLTISGHVIAVGSAATVSSGVVNYYVTITLNQTDKALKQGMTGNATVTVSKAENALTVPNLAITRTAGQAFVTVYDGGQEIQTPVETGVVGDQFTEITGGLNDGEQIVLPTVRVATGTGAGTTRGGGFGGGGGGIRVGAGG
jgi:HlyD family secretion protein